jgi:hypothetical protein
MPLRERRRFREHVTKKFAAEPFSMTVNTTAPAQPLAGPGTAPGTP